MRAGRRRRYLAGLEIARKKVTFVRPDVRAGNTHSSSWRPSRCAPEARRAGPEGAPVAVARVLAAAEVPSGGSTAVITAFECFSGERGDTQPPP